MTDKPRAIFSGNALQIMVLAAGKIIAMFATIAMPFFLSRQLTRESYGIYFQFNTVSCFIINLASFGFPAAAYYFFARLKKTQHKTIIFNSICAISVITILFCLLLNSNLVWEKLHWSKDLQAYVPFIAIYIFLVMPGELMEPFYIVRGDKFISLVYPPLMILLKVAAVVMFAKLLSSALTGVFVGLLAASGLVAFFVLTYFGLRIRHDAGEAESGVAQEKAPLFSLPLLKEQIRFVIPFGSAATLEVFARQFDKLVCLAILLPSEYTLYGIAFFSIPGIDQIRSSIGSVYLVRMTEAFKSGRKENVHTILKNLVIKQLSFSIPVILCVLWFADTIISFVYSRSNAAAAPFFRMYIWSFVFTMFGAGLVIRACGRTRLSMISYACSALVTIPLTYFCVTRFGMWGGISSAVVSLFLPRAIQIGMEMRILESNLVDYFPWRGIGRILLISAVVLIPFASAAFFTEPLFSPKYFYWKVVYCGVLSAIYLAAAFLIEIRCNLFVLDRTEVLRLFDRFHCGFLAWFVGGKLK